MRFQEKKHLLQDRFQKFLILLLTAMSEAIQLSKEQVSALQRVYKDNPASASSLLDFVSRPAITPRLSSKQHGGRLLGNELLNDDKTCMSQTTKTSTAVDVITPKSLVTTSTLNNISNYHRNSYVVSPPAYPDNPLGTSRVFTKVRTVLRVPTNFPSPLTLTCYL